MVEYSVDGSTACFNLAIEMLFISGLANGYPNVSPHRSFNLAIEMLFISGDGDWRTAAVSLSCFNLAIEMLFISGVKIG